MLLLTDRDKHTIGESRADRIEQVIAAELVQSLEELLSKDRALLYRRANARMVNVI